jgi:hypothetical protein
MATDYDCVPGRSNALSAQETSSADPATETNKPVRFGVLICSTDGDYKGDLKGVKCNDVLHLKFSTGCQDYSGDNYHIA